MHVNLNASFLLLAVPATALVAQSIVSLWLSLAHVRHADVGHVSITMPYEFVDADPDPGDVQWYYSAANTAAQCGTSRHLPFLGP